MGIGERAALKVFISYSIHTSTTSKVDPPLNFNITSEVEQTPPQFWYPIFFIGK